jgi:hypothetical protein
MAGIHCGMPPLPEEIWTRSNLDPVPARLPYAAAAALAARRGWTGLQGDLLDGAA